MEKDPPRVVQGTPALNLSPELDIQLFGVHDGAGPWRHCAGEMDQVQAVKCPKTKVGDKQIGGPSSRARRASANVATHRTSAKSEMVW